MSNNVYVFKLKSIKVLENGKVEKEVEGSNILEAKLIYPKEGIPALTTIRNMELEDAAPKIVSNDSMMGDVLFKQSFDGESVLEFNVCAEVRNISLEKEMFKILGILTKEAIKKISSLGTIATAAITSFTDSIFSFTPKKTVIIGSVSIPLKGNFEGEDQAFKLTVPKDVEIVKMRRNYPSNNIVFDRLELKEGDHNGEIVIDIIKLD